MSIPWLSLNNVLSDGRSNQMGVTSSAPSPCASGFENNAERLIGARLSWGGSLVLKQWVFKKFFEGEETPWGKLPRQKHYWELDWEALLSWKLCALELGMSDLQNSFFFFFRDPKIEVVDAVSVSFFNGSDLYLAVCCEVRVQYFWSLALRVMFGLRIYCSVDESVMGVVLWVIALLKTHEWPQIKVYF